MGKIISVAVGGLVLILALDAAIYNASYDIDGPWRLIAQVAIGVITIAGGLAINFLARAMRRRDHES